MNHTAFNPDAKILYLGVAFAAAKAAATAEIEALPKGTDHDDETVVIDVASAPAWVLALAIVGLNPKTPAGLTIRQSAADFLK